MAERKPDNRWRRVIGGGVITCLSVALLALMTWAQRMVDVYLERLLAWAGTDQYAVVS